MNSNELLYALNDVDPKIIRSAEPGQRKIRTSVCCVAAALVLIAAVVWVAFSNGAKSEVTAARIYLDVNPSFVLDVSARGKILEVIAENDDAQKVLSENRDLTDKKHVTISGLLDGIMKSGYLSVENDTILLSVDCADDVLAEELRSALADDAGRFLNATLPTGHAITQSLTENEQADLIAGNYGISIGKASFLIRLIGLRDEYTADKLASLDVSDLRGLCEENNVSTGNRIMLRPTDAYDVACNDMNDFIGDEVAGGTIYGYVDNGDTGSWRIVLEGGNNIAIYDIDGETGGIVAAEHAPLLSREQMLDAAIEGAGLASDDVEHYDVLKTEAWIWRYVSIPQLSREKRAEFLANGSDLNSVVLGCVTLHTLDGRFMTAEVNGITGEVVSVGPSSYSYSIDFLDAVLIAAKDAGLEPEIPDPSHFSGLFANGICDLKFEYDEFIYIYQIDAYTGEVLSANAVKSMP